MNDRESGSESDHVHNIVTNNEYAHEYAVTIKDNRTGSEDYETAITHLKKFGLVSQMYAETTTKLGKSTKRHLHGILQTNDKLYYKAVKLKGFMFFFREIYNTGWEQYIQKEVTDLDWSKNQFSKLH